ncbi:MAG TPA: type II toxin-antitoxin system RelE/ParE family toxin [Thermoanaerobaculia bacterium]|nr:type II toxin-antitoxin system RelE/ParE family toxin [Thermoanaerobaculia bacterium]
MAARSAPSCEFNPEARAEFAEASRYYQERSGSGEALEEEVRRAVRMILEFPESSPVVTAEGARRKNLRRFPYSLYYLIEPDVIRIMAVAHQSRLPGYWTDRR